MKLQSRRQIVIPSWNFSLESEINEIWESVYGYEGIYEVSSTGRMKTHNFSKIAKIVSPKVTHKSYIWYALNKNCVRKSILAHRLVAQTFIKNPTLLPQVNHINGIKTDNSVINLEWCTNQQNMDHAIRTGLIKHLVKGEKNPKAFINNSIVYMIRYGEYKDKRICEIAKILGCSWCTVSNARKYKTWTHI